MKNNNLIFVIIKEVINDFNSESEFSEDKNQAQISIKIGNITYDDECYYGFLSKIKEKLEKKFGSEKLKNIISYGLNEFTNILKNQMKKFNNNPREFIIGMGQKNIKISSFISNDKINQLKNENESQMEDKNFEINDPTKCYETQLLEKKNIKKKAKKLRKLLENVFVCFLIFLLIIIFILAVSFLVFRH